MVRGVFVAGTCWHALWQSQTEHLTAFVKHRWYCSDVRRYHCYTYQIYWCVEFFFSNSHSPLSGYRLTSCQQNFATLTNKVIFQVCWPIFVGLCWRWRHPSRAIRWRRKLTTVPGSPAAIGRKCWWHHLPLKTSCGQQLEVCGYSTDVRCQRGSGAATWIERYRKTWRLFV